MKTKKLLVIFIVISWILTACQSNSNLPTATIVSPKDTPVPTNTVKPISTPIPSTPTLPSPSITALTTIVPENFIEYDSTDFIKENNISDRIPVFSFKYPSEWEYGWFSDSGVIALLISSGDVNDAWSLQETSGATMMIIPTPYSGEKLVDLFFFVSDIGLVAEPSTTTINNQEAARVEYENDGKLQIEVVIVRAKWALSVVTFFPAEKETEFRSLIEGIIGTIEIK